MTLIANFMAKKPDWWSLVFDFAAVSGFRFGY